MAMKPACVRSDIAKDPIIHRKMQLISDQLEWDGYEVMMRKDGPAVKIDVVYFPKGHHPYLDIQWEVGEADVQQGRARR